jgi:hypothetical protein
LTGPVPVENRRLGGGAIYERSEAVKNHRQKNFFTCPFKEKIKKWNSV